MKRVIILFIFLFICINVNAYEVEYIHQDHLGNNIAITNEEGDIIWKADYEPFGDTFNEVGINNKKYNNKEEDENTNLLYYSARYYDNNIGRFTTPDPISGSITNPQSLNRYVYVQNNPMKFIDPTGKIVEFALGAEKLKPIVKDMDVYQRLISHPTMTFTFRMMEDDSLWGAGIFAAYRTDGTILVPPLALKSDPKELESTLYHEQIHALQQMEKRDLTGLLLNHEGLSIEEIVKKKEKLIPFWKDKFRGIELGKELGYKHVGSELEAHYLQAVYEYEHFGGVSEGVLVGFFVYSMKFKKGLEQATNLDSDEIKNINNLVSGYNEEIKRISGHTLESYIEQHKKK